MRRNVTTLFLGMGLSLYLSSVAVADPIPGRDVLKFSQQPMLNLAIPSEKPDQFHFFHGHDELSTAYSAVDDGGNIVGYKGRFMADDFADGFDSPVVHVKWWGSYLQRPSKVDDPFVKKFLISFEKDVPADPENPKSFSHPGEPLLNQIVTRDTDGVLTRGSGTFTERPVWRESVDGPIYEYNAELHLDKVFPQEPDTVYWLKIVALVDVPPNTVDDRLLQWGWHNRLYTEMDPLASTFPAVDPGERIQGSFFTPNGREVPVWHFQDDAVSGRVRVELDAKMPWMPLVRQDGYAPQHYVPPYDGPEAIKRFSKDLAFELYTTPEPSSCALALLALVGCSVAARRRRR